MRVLIALIALAAVVAAEDMESVTFRVISLDPVTIDRGTRDGLAAGDAVTFQPRDGGTYGGVVIEVAERTAVIELHDRGNRPEPGTRGEARVPKRRFAAPEGGREGDGDGGGGDKSKWKNKDENYKAGDPLLTGMRPVKPEEREARVFGRVYLIAELTQDIEGYLDDSLGRLGTDITAENPFGLGGVMRFDGEVAWLTDQRDDEGADALLRRLSYRLGGTRFTAWQATIGRFLQGMAEFGVMDGIEVGMRRDGGDRFAFSIGYLPEPDEDFESLIDFSVAGYYEWVVDKQETMVIAAGFQKTWHHGREDRDLLVLRAHYVPKDRWHFFGTVWIDFYLGGEVIRSGVDVSQAVLSLLRTWQNGNGLDFTYTRQRIPEILRNEFTPVAADELLDNHYDRIAVDGRLRHVRGHLSAWIDEDDQGGAAELGLEFADVFLEQSRFELVAFGALAKFEHTIGMRILFGRQVGDVRWEILGEVSNHHRKGFPSDRDDILQERVRVNVDLPVGKEWDCNVHGEAIFFDGEVSWNLGFFLQRRF